MGVVSEILSWYGSDNPGTLTSLSRLLNSGALGGTGKLVILPVDQGFAWPGAQLRRGAREARRGGQAPWPGRRGVVLSTFSAGTEK
jgi:hypothetical protein